MTKKKLASKYIPVTLGIHVNMYHLMIKQVSFYVYQAEIMIHRQSLYCIIERITLFLSILDAGAE